MPLKQEQTNNSGSKKWWIILLITVQSQMSVIEHMKIPFVRVVFAVLTSISLSRRGYRKNSLNFDGALAALVVGIIITTASYQFFFCLLVFFLSSSYVTKLKTDRKRRLEENFVDGGQRNAVQVFSNGGLAAIISILYICEVGPSERPIDFANDFVASTLTASFIGVISCCNGDTWSSEIGLGYGPDMPTLITTFQKVPAGTNGAVSFIGLLASGIGGLIIGLTVYVTDLLVMDRQLFINSRPAQWPVILMGLFAGIAGSLIDSLLGAMFQYSGYCVLRKKIVGTPSSTTKHVSGIYWLDNHGVNFFSTLIMAILVPLFSYNYFHSIVAT